MSGQKMQEEFEAWLRSPIGTDHISRGMWQAWQAACASKQKEIDEYRTEWMRITEGRKQQIP